MCLVIRRNAVYMPVDGVGPAVMPTRISADEVELNVGQPLGTRIFFDGRKKSVISRRDFETMYAASGETNNETGRC